MDRVFYGPVWRGAAMTHSLGDLLDEAKQVVTGERLDIHGDPENSFTLIAGYYSAFLSHRLGIPVALTPLDAVNMAILFKQARKLGQTPHRDNYRDAAGYEAIAADRMLEVEE